jgi:hypothetical protein
MTGNSNRRERRLIPEKPIRKKSVLCGKMGEETVLYDEESGAIHVLNPTALHVWNCCDGKHGIEDIEHSVRDAFSVKEGRSIAADIVEAIERFYQDNLFENA